LIVTVASFKGGQAKTTKAVHLAALLNAAKPTLLMGGDPIAAPPVGTDARDFRAASWRKGRPCALPSIAPDPRQSAFPHSPEPAGDSQLHGTKVAKARRPSVWTNWQDGDRGESNLKMA